MQSLGSINKIDAVELKTLKKRIDIATVVIIFFIAILIVRLWFLQIHSGSDYVRLSESNRVRMQYINAPRGNIMDRKARTIITNRPCFNVIWVREDAPNPGSVIKKLSKILDEDISTILGKIRTGADFPRYMPIRLKEDIDWETLVYIENNHFNLPGVGIEVVPRRDYLFNDLGAHLIGYLGEINPKELENLQFESYQGGDQIGKMGLEKLQEKHLKGEKGQNYLEVDVHGFQQKQLKVQKPLPGNDLQLTIDIDLQQKAEESMKGKAGSIVAMEVNTGKLLILASTPPLHLREFVGGISTKSWQALLNNPMKPLVNKSIQGQYPPGSTYKIVTALAALSEEVVTPDTIFYCAGYLSFGNRKYGCWKKGGHGATNLHKALAESCDVYFYQVSQKLGVDTLALYASGLGLGKKTGIILEHEKKGLVPTSAWKLQRYNEAWQEGETLSVSIGQGYNLATPLQVCRMTAATVNGGILYQPQLIEAINDPDGKTVQGFSPIIDGEILGTKESLQLINNALVSAVNDKRGTGKKARLKNILVGGKTGTAQVVHLSQFKDVPDEEIPYKYRDHAWFTCFAPAENPKIAITVLVEHGGHGGSAAAPIAQKILKQYFELQNEKHEAANN